MNGRRPPTSASAIAGLPRPIMAAQDPLRLKVEAVVQQILPDGDGMTAMLGSNGAMRGPELRAERVTLAVANGLDEDTAVHWHGIRLKNKMGGIPVSAQIPIDPGTIKTYSFAPPDAGTCWYHSHYISNEQVAQGMMGSLIVEGDVPPDADHDITMLLSDWRMQDDGTQLHGHHFYQIGEGDAWGDLRDTIRVDAETRRDIICVFDNPGRGLLHCHILSHAVGGMRTWVNVA